MKKYLITGCCGFVARYFVELLRSEGGAEIVGVDIPQRCVLEAEDFRYERMNLTERHDIYRLLESFRPDYIVHLASVSSVADSWKAPVESFVNNTNIFLNIADGVRELKLNSRILSVGSSEEYGNRPVSDMPLREDYQLRPNNPYSVARVSQELISKLYADSFGVDIVMTRSFNHIGPSQRDVFVVPSFVKQLVEIKRCGGGVMKTGDISIVRDFLDVRDVVKAYHKILLSGAKGEVYNVCSGEGVSLESVICEISSILEVKPRVELDPSRVRPADNAVIIGDNSKLVSTLGWKRSYTLNDTLKDMVAFAQEQV